MHRTLPSIQKLSSLAKFRTTIMLSPMSGIKLRTSKKSSSTVFEELSSEYLQKYNEKQQKNTSQLKQTKQNKKATGNANYKHQEQDLVQIEGLKNSWLGNALQDDLLVQTKQWEGENDAQNLSSQQQQPQNLNQKHQSSFKQPSLLEQSKKLFPSKPVQQQNSQPLKVKSFKKQLSKTQLINNSRKFLEIICNIFPRHQVERIIAEMKQFCAKRDLNIPSLIGINMDDGKHSGQIRKSQQRKVEKEMKIIEKITKDRQKKLFIGVRRIFDQSLTDLQLIDNLLSLLSNSDPYIMNNENIHKFIYNHEQGIFDDQALHHKAQINLMMDKKQHKSLTQKEEQKTIDELIDAKKDFLKESEQIMNKALKKKQPNLDQQSQEDFINVFEEFQRENEKQNTLKNKTAQSKDTKQKEKQRQERKREKSMKLIVKKNLPTQKQPIPEHFEINQHSLNEIERILFKNKKIVEDNIVFKKVRAKTVNTKLEKEREDFGKNWVYAYDMPYALQHESSQDFIDYISKTYGNVIEYYIFPYKSMLQKRENIMLHVQNEKRLKTQKLHQTLSLPKQLKPSVADKLLQKIDKEKNLKLNKSSMVFKFLAHQAKQSFLLPEMRLYGINYKLFRNIRFEQAQSKKIIAISMIPWGCSSQDLLKAINKALKPIEVEVSYQSCILAKGFIFIEFDNFYESLNACNLLNNLQFQGHNLKVQINYGSSKLYGAKYKNSLEFDHYQTLVKKFNEIKCFYNEVYQD